MCVMDKQYWYHVSFSAFYCFSVACLLINASKPGRQYDIIVIGSGLAGSAAARHLRNHPSGRYNVKILEARYDRLGGRSWTDRSATGALGADSDLGPAWVEQMIPGQHFQKALDKMELTLMDPGMIEFHALNGSFQYDSATLYNTLQKHMMKEIHKESDQRKAGIDFAMSEIFHESSVDSEFDPDIWSIIVRELVESLFGTSLDQLSARQFAVAKLSKSYHVVEGADEIVNRLIGGIDMESPIEVELGNVVRQVFIDYKQQKVKVRTTNRKNYVADAVILAVSLGVLKNDFIIFDPPFTKQRQQAIEKLGYGLINKVIVYFDKNFWSTEGNTGMFMDITDHQAASPSHLNIRTWINGYRLTNTPSLIGYLIGTDASALENLKDITILKIATESLSRIFGDDVISRHNVTDIRISRWQTDEFARGTVTYSAIGNTREMIKELSVPVCPYLFFAGEHTSVDRQGTMEGAYISGIEAAELLINRCKYDSTKSKHSEL